MASNNNAYKKDVSKLNTKIEKGFYGLDTAKDSANLNALASAAKASLKKINSYAVTGKRPDIVQFINENVFTSRNTSNSSSKYKNANGFIDEVESGRTSLIFNEDTNRFSRYRSIDAVCAMIPQLGRIVQLYRDMIISPNDFKNTDFEFIINNSNIDDEVEIESQQTLLKELDEKYKVSEELSLKLVGDLVKYGDGFAVCLNFESEVNDILNGSVYGQESVQDNRDLSASGMSIAQEEASTLNSMVKEFINNDYDKYVARIGKDRKPIAKPVFSDMTPEKWETEVDKFLNVEYSENLYKLLGQDEVEILKEMAETDSLQEIENSSKGKKYEIASEAAGKVSRYNLTGSIIRHLEPTKTIKVEVGGTCIGYYYLDVMFSSDTHDSLSYDPNACAACDLTFNTNRSMYSFVSHLNRKGATGIDQKAQVLTDIFVKRLGKKINKKWIAKNSQFRDFIYTILKANKAIERTSVIFIPASRVIHFKRGTRTYGESVLDPVLYFAKLYSLSMLSALMQQIIMGKDKQVFYVETGLDEDSEGAVQSFIADMRSREITIDDFSDITAIINRVTASNAMYIPTVDGKKAVEFDTYAGRPAEINNDFLDHMLKSIVAGTGFPSSWLDTGMSEVEFATQLVQQNGNVLKTINMYQKITNRGFTTLFRQLKENEKTSGTTEFEVRYPPPTTLDGKQMEESSTRATALADFIIQTVMGEQPSEADEACRPEFRKALIKKYTSGIDWEEVEELLKSIREDSKEADLMKAREEIIKEAANAQPANSEGGEESGGSNNPWG
jgi:hypothetical protein